MTSHKKILKYSVSDRLSTAILEWSELKLPVRNVDHNSDENMNSIIEHCTIKNSKCVCGKKAIDCLLILNRLNDNMICVSFDCIRQDFCDNIWIYAYLIKGYINHEKFQCNYCFRYPSRNYDVDICNYCTGKAEYRTSSINIRLLRNYKDCSSCKSQFSVPSWSNFDICKCCFHGKTLRPHKGSPKRKLNHKK